MKREIETKKKKKKKGRYLGRGGFKRFG